MAARILNKIGRSIAKSASKSVPKAGSALAYAGGSPKALAAVGAVAFMGGMANEIGPAARDAAFEATLGTPDADRYFTGRKFSARFLAGRFMGGRVGSMMQSTAPLDLMATGSGMPQSPVGAIAGGSGLGGLGGALVGAGIAAKRGGSTRSKVLGGIAGGVAGTVVGGAVGGAVPYVAAAEYVRSNRGFFSQSPYGRSTANNDLSAVGDIVLGMHNSRRGY